MSESFEERLVGLAQQYLEAIREYDLEHERQLIDTCLTLVLHDTKREKSGHAYSPSRQLHGCTLREFNRHTIEDLRVTAESIVLDPPSTVYEVRKPKASD